MDFVPTMSESVPLWALLAAIVVPAVVQTIVAIINSIQTFRLAKIANQQKWLELDNNRRIDAIDGFSNFVLDASKTYGATGQYARYQHLIFQYAPIALHKDIWNLYNEIDISREPKPKRDSDSPAPECDSLMQESVEYELYKELGKIVSKLMSPEYLRKHY